MLFFSSPEAAAHAGYRIVDYDTDRQLFIVEKGNQRLPLRSRPNTFTVLLDEPDR